MGLLGKLGGNFEANVVLTGLLTSACAYCLTGACGGAYAGKAARSESDLRHGVPPQGLIGSLNGTRCLIAIVACE